MEILGICSPQQKSYSANRYIEWNETLERNNRATKSERKKTPKEKNNADRESQEQQQAHNIP